MRRAVLATLFAIMMVFIFSAAGSAQTLPRVGETWQLKIDGFGCARNDDLDQLLRLRHDDDQNAFSALLHKLRGEERCRELPKGLEVVVERIEPYGMLNDRPCVRGGGSSVCWYTLPAFLRPVGFQ
jgi:hypothetical protein